jgi:hypothetical protein
MALYMFPHGSHQLQRPRERQASMQLSVDWMNFWLQGKEDPSPAKVEQYAYWRTLKKQRDERWAKAGHPGRPPSPEERELR